VPDSQTQEELRVFTGIIEDVGFAKTVDRRAGGIMAEIKCGLPIEDIEMGESISVNGVCLTVTGKGRDSFSVEISEETARRSTMGKLKPGNPVNLERALRVGGRLGGHLVYGHVDGIAVLRGIEKDGESRVFYFEAGDNIMKYVVYKGSVAVDGVSLTVSEVSRVSFEVTVLPYTYENTTFRYLKTGDTVNVEVDIIGKYVEKLIGRSDDDRLQDVLKKSGFISED